MRNSLIRKILGFAGCTLSGAAIGNLFSFVIAAAQLSMWAHFCLFLIAAVLALFGLVRVVVPSVAAWINRAETSEIVGRIDPMDIVKSLNTRFAGIFAK